MCKELFVMYLSKVHELKWSWPPTSNGLAALAGQALDFATYARSVQHKGYGLRGGRTPECNYLVKHFARVLLLHSPQSGYDRYVTAGCSSTEASGFSDLTLGAVLAWTPDECSHCAALASMPCRDVERLFGVHPLLLSMWTCLVGQVPPDGLSNLRRATDAAVLAALECDEAAQLTLPPSRRFRMGPRALADALRGGRSRPQAPAPARARSRSRCQDKKSQSCGSVEADLSASRNLLRTVL